MNLLIVSDIN